MAPNRRALLFALALGLFQMVVCGTSAPSRLSMDFSSSLIVSPDSAPASVMSNLAALLSDMADDGVNNLCKGRQDSHVCGNEDAKKPGFLPFSLLPILLSGGKGQSASTGCSLCLPPAPTDSAPCSCTAPGNKTRCTCTGKLTGQQYFNADWYGLELSTVLVEAVGETQTINGGINANFNSTVRLINSKLYVTPGEGANGEGVHDLELDESHLDLLDGSEVHIQDDGDMEVEDAGTLWLANSSQLVASNASNIQTQLAHILVEGGSSISIKAQSSWNVTQEFDFTPVQAAGVCNTPFKPNAAAEACFNDKEACTARMASGLLSAAEKQALGMIKYPPALDRWGRQAFDYADDNVYDDYYDVDYTEPQLEDGACLGSDICSIPGTAAATSSTGANHKRSLLENAPTPDDQATVETNSTAATTVHKHAKLATQNTRKARRFAKHNKNNSGANADASKHSNASSTAEGDKDTAKSTNKDASDGGSTSMSSGSASSSAAKQAAAPAPASAPIPATTPDGDNEDEGLAPTEVNGKDTLDGSGYDPVWGEGPYGESLCDAPPFRAFNYYGIIVRDGSHIRITSQSTWTLFDQSRVFIKDSTVTLEDGARLVLLNSTIVLINSTLVITGSSEIYMEKFSSLQLYQSKLMGDNALYAVPANSTWQGEIWQQRGDYRASPGGGLPVSMGVQPGMQVGTYPMRVFGFDMDARLMPAAGCKCKKAQAQILPTAAEITTVPGGNGVLENLI